MTLLTFEVLKNFLGTISLMALLAVCYSMVTRAVTRKVVTQAVLGTLFGGAAIASMLNPFQLTDGVIVDMRIVPVTLAGAFLGLPDAAPTTLMALAMRIGIGGQGMAFALALPWRPLSDLLRTRNGSRQIF